ncbi:GntR family transcriptional regulator [Sinobacterium caligoides]|uniref:GntR family transcriptional regulator n=1 Tax=Sinobacterium caligoides TaxID=933926 RepID=A0A3N2DPV0_9GAMM|nr:PLP-dependent aminotransferase family protein [Sinobacterium caligoides]ROS01712.1 GntR family transcriptional regulator [Sinobacterium caligoides]
MPSYDCLVQLELNQSDNLQRQIRQYLLQLISSAHFMAKPLPSCRKMAKLLGVSRNTIVLVYESLVDDGYLQSRERSGFYVHEDIYKEGAAAFPVPQPQAHKPSIWGERLEKRTTMVQNIEKPSEWFRQPYPFIYGQIEQHYFPIQHWRACSRVAQQRDGLKDWLDDYVDSDDPMLVEQIRQQLLSKRGIACHSDEILITIGTQNSLYILAQLLVRKDSTFGIEEPGYTDARNIFALAGAQLQPLEIDAHGAKTNHMAGCDCVFLTPSHQVPTNITMSPDRRQAVLAQAKAHDFIIIEDDYESEINSSHAPSPALKSLDSEGRVIYVSSLSKSLSPGLRLGFLVADRELVAEARALRRLMYRHPPSNNQRTAALFMAQGHYDSYLRGLRNKLADKAEVMRRGIQRHLNQCNIFGDTDGSSFWLQAPEFVDCALLAKRALQAGIVIEAGAVHFHRKPAPRNFFRLGFAAIPIERIDEGLEKLGQLIEDYRQLTLVS